MEIFGIFLLVVLGGFTIITLLVVLNLLVPNPIEETRIRLEEELGRSLLLGFVNFVFFAVLVAVFIWISQESGEILGGVFFFLALAVTLGILAFVLLGLSAFAHLLGDRIGGEKTPFVSSLRGGTLLLLASLAPYIGWFFFAPLMIWAGFGAAISAIIRKKEKSFVEVTGDN